MSNETVLPKKPIRKETIPPKESVQKILQQTESPAESKGFAAALRQFLVEHPKYLVAGWSLVALAFLAAIPAAYISWYLLGRQLLEFANKEWWHWLPAFFGFMFLFAIPVWVVMGATWLAGFFADLSLSIQGAEIKEAQKTVEEREQEALSKLEETDEAGLLPLLKYSRAQLDAYYVLGLNQTRRSFSHAVLAMWLGFILLLIGIVLYIAPVENIGLKPPSQDFQTLVLIGALIIEFVSALFLWVYRSTIGQFTYFYRTQMYSHTSILSFRMASTMEREKADDTKRAIIEKVLDATVKPERPPIVGAKGLHTLLSAGTPKATTQ